MSMPKQYAVLGFIFTFIVGSIFILTAEAATLTFSPAKSTVNTGESVALSVTGAQGQVHWQTFEGEIQGWGKQVTYVAPDAPGEVQITVTDSAGHVATLTLRIEGFLNLKPSNVLFLLFVGFIGGLVSGFIGSGGAFVLTPAMMSMGVPAIVAVASNMCHKFPKALVGAIKRARYGQVDVKLGIVLGISAEIGVLVGVNVQTYIKAMLGDAGSNLYVSLVFVIVLAIVGSYVLLDAWKMHTSANPDLEKTSRLAHWIRAVHIPGTMMYFKSINARISVLFTIPIGFLTGMLAATIAVGGFIGVPAMIYVLGVPSLIASATELVIAFVMGMGGSIKYAWEGFVDIRLAMIILAGSLFGVQLGAIGTTYVKPYMVKMVMGIIMLLVLLSRGLMIPLYLSDLQYIAPLTPTTENFLKHTSYAILVIALTTGGIIILSVLWRGRQVAMRAPVLSSSFSLPTVENVISPNLNRVMLVTAGTEINPATVREAINLAQKMNKQLRILSVIKTNPEYEALATKLLEKEQQEAIVQLEALQATVTEVDIQCEIMLRHGTEVYAEIVDEMCKSQIDIAVMGRRGKAGLVRTVIGNTTARVIGHTIGSILVIPRIAPPIGKHFLLAIDGSRYSEAATIATIHLARLFDAQVDILSVIHIEHTEKQQEAESLVEQTKDQMSQAGIVVTSLAVVGRPAEAIIENAKIKGVDLIAMGSHGRTGLERMLLGSVSDRVIGLTECAVLVARAVKKH